MGPAGGKLQVEIVTLVIPEGALDRKLTVTLAISYNQTDMPHCNDDQRLTGPVIHLLPHGLRFKKPATLSFDISSTAALRGSPNMQVLCR